MTPSKLRILTTIRSMQENEEDMGLQEIAAKCGCSEPYVHKVIKWAIKEKLIKRYKNRHIYEFAGFDKNVT